MRPFLRSTGLNGKPLLRGTPIMPSCPLTQGYSSLSLNDTAFTSSITPSSITDMSTPTPGSSMQQYIQARFIHNPKRFRVKEITRRLHPKERKLVRDARRKPFKMGPVLPPQKGPWIVPPFEPCNAWVMNMDMKPVGMVDLERKVFQTEIRTDLLHRTVVWWRALKRQGTHKGKDRSEVRGGGRKPMPQKGQGRARVGSLRAPNRRGGGRAFPRLPKDYSYALPVKVQQAAMRSALTAKFREGNLLVVDEITSDSWRTKDVDNKLTDKWSLLTGLIIHVEGELDPNFIVATRCLDYINYLPVNEANVYDILRHRTLILTKKGLEALTQRCQFIRNRAMFACPEKAPRPASEVMAEVYDKEGLRLYVPTTHTPVVVPLSDKDAALFEKLKRSAAREEE